MKHFSLLVQVDFPYVISYLIHDEYVKEVHYTTIH